MFKDVFVLFGIGEKLLLLDIYNNMIENENEGIKRKFESDVQNSKCSRKIYLLLQLTSVISGLLWNKT